VFSPIAVGLLGKFIWWGVFYVICVDVEPEARVKCEVGRPITGLNPQWAPFWLTGRSKAAHLSSASYHILLSVIVCYVFVSNCWSFYV